MPKGPKYRSYARTPEGAYRFTSALRGFLFCPHCGVTDVGITMPKMSHSAVVVRCKGCGLEYYARRQALADSARRLAAEADDPKVAALYERVAAIFQPNANRRHQYPTVTPPEHDVDVEV